MLPLNVVSLGHRISLLVCFLHESDVIGKARAIEKLNTAQLAGRVLVLTPLNPIRVEYASESG